MRGKLLDDCFLHDKERMRHDEALALLRARIAPVAGSETVALENAPGRILAEPVAAPRPVPAHDNAAVDGYAFAHGAYLAHEGRLRVLARIAAGHPSDIPLEDDACARIFTGAAMPAGADTVAMQEDVRIEEKGGVSFAIVPRGLRAGANRRKAGEDVAEGSLVAEAGHMLRPQDIAAIASTGADTVQCHARLRVALVSTGDEIVRPGQALAHGQVYDSNHFMIRALLEPLGCAVTDLGVLADRADIVGQALKSAARNHDAVITTGGASRGEEDHIVTTLQALGHLHMWQLAIKPGRPMSFGQVDDCVFLGLPGNPVAVMVCFLLYVRPLLLRLGGAHWSRPRSYLLPAVFAMTKKPDRREFLRGIITGNGGGAPGVDKFARDGSGLITSLREADGLIEIAEETTRIEIGDPVAFMPFSQFGIPGRA